MATDPRPARPPVEFLGADTTPRDDLPAEDSAVDQRPPPLLGTRRRKVTAGLVALCLGSAITVAEFTTGTGPAAHHRPRAVSLGTPTRPGLSFAPLPANGGGLSSARVCRLSNYVIRDLAQMTAAYRRVQAQHGPRSAAEAAALRTISAYSQTRQSVDERSWTLDLAELQHGGLGETFTEFAVGTC